MGLFSQLNDHETHILVAKLMSGATTLDELNGADHETIMDLYDNVGEVQKNYQRGASK